MSESLLAGRRFLLDGHERLGADYDDEGDVLYLWRGEGPREAVSLTTEDGIVARFDPESGDLVGITILDYATRWQHEREILILLPAHGEHESEEEEPTQHSLLAMAV